MNSTVTRLSKNLGLSIALAVSLQLMVPTALAGEVTYFSSTLIHQSETLYEPNWSNVTNSYFENGLMATSSQTSLNVTDSFGRQRATASASLETGALRALASGDGMSDANNKSALSLTSIARLGDSFSLLNPDGSPFSISGSNARFSLQLTGQSSVGGSTTWTSPSATAYVELFILKKGSIDRWKPNAEFGLTSVHVEDILQVFQWGGTPTSNWALDYSTYGTTYKMHEIPILQDGDTAIADFEALGDFDWTVRLITGIFLPSGDETAYSVSDFSHTLEVSFDAPYGATTRSASGVFPGTTGGNAVPEPGTLAVFMSAVALLGWSRRDRVTRRDSRS